MQQQSRPRSISLVVVLEAMSSLFGFVGGIPLMLDPSGKLLNMPLSYLSSFPLPIHDFLLPGLWLTFGYGVGLAATAVLLWRRRPYAWDVAVVLGLVWLCWVSYQLAYVGPVPFVAVWLVPQALALPLLARPSTRRWASGRM